jgi:hypothetical protein
VDGRWRVVLCLLAAAVSAWAVTRLDDRMYTPAGFSLWFHADTPGWLWYVADRGAFLDRTTIHPLFSIPFNTAARLLTRTGVAPLVAAKALLVLAAAATIDLFYRTLRNLGLDAYAAGAFACAFIASATFIHWFAFVSVYPFGGLSVAFMLWVATTPAVPRRLTWWFASVATLGMMITNWVLSLAASLRRLSWRESVRINAAAFAFVAIVALAQRAAFTDAALFFNPIPQLQERLYSPAFQASRGHGGWNPAAQLRSMWLFSAVTPPTGVEFVLEANLPTEVLTNQRRTLSDHGLAGRIATACWVLLLALGLWGMFLSWRRPVVLAIAISAAWQVVLHLVYGEVTFLYAINFFPLFLAVAALGALTPAGRAATLAAVLFAGTGAVANLQSFTAAVRASTAFLDANPAPPGPMPVYNGADASTYKSP